MTKRLTDLRQFFERMRDTQLLAGGNRTDAALPVELLHAAGETVDLPAAFAVIASEQIKKAISGGADLAPQFAEFGFEGFTGDAFHGMLRIL